MPGILHPRNVVRPTESEAERVVHRALQTQLPEGWEAWHSFRFQTREGKGTNLREIDFLVLVPSRGLIVIEVKGGPDWHRVDGVFYRDKEGKDAVDPLHQLLGAQRELRRTLKLSHSSKGGVETSALLIFPDVRGHVVPEGSDVNGRVFLAPALQHLGEALLAYANRFLPPQGSSTTALRGLIDRSWGDGWTPQLRFADALAERKRTIAELDTAQRMLARRTDVRGTLLVLGSPGSGKTLVAREVLIRAREQGKSAFYFCYTRALAMAMRSEGLTESYPIRDFMEEKIRQLNPDIDPQSSPQWNEEHWRAVAEQVAALMPNDLDKPDVLVVDEAQDLSPAEWRFVELLRGPSTPLLAFADPDQRFLEEAQLDEANFDVVLRLGESYRTPDAITRRALKWRAGEKVKLPPSDVLEFMKIGKSQKPWETIRRAIKKLRKRGVRDEEIAVLSLASRTRRTMRPANDPHNDVEPVEADDARASQTLILDTALRFKGLERPWIVITDLGEMASENARQRLYVAATRCTAGCMVVGTQEELDRIGVVGGAR